MRKPMLWKNETIVAKGRCATLRLYIIGGPKGYRWAALNGKTELGTFSCFKDAADARDSMTNRVRMSHPRAPFRFV